MPSLTYSTDKRKLIWGGPAVQTQSDNGLQHEVYKAILIDLVYDDNGLFMLLKPTVKIVRTDGEAVDKEIKKTITKQILDRKYNGEFNQDLDNWRTSIFAKEKTLSLEFPKASGSGYTFVIQATPLFAKVEKASGGQELPDNPTYYKFNAVQFEEPGLLFSSSDGLKQIREVHPLKGLIQNKPFDYSLTAAGLSKQTTLGVICPSAYNDKFHRFLSLQHGSVKVTNTKENYSIDYPGYASVYNIALNIPTAQDPRWQDYQIDPKLTSQNNCRHIAEQIKNSIDRIYSSSEVSLIVICIPAELSDFTSYTEGKEVFDLHDHIKAYAIQKGVTTQFLEEKTLDNSGQANRIHWWLSLSMYVKTMRTPWVLQNLDSNTAFAGIGYSIDYSAEENHIVMGCSHIYNSRGEGLRYRLAKVERPIYRDKRPHLSYEDAYQFGISTLQLFVEASNKMPESVVIHKRTFYTEDEKRGILDGLKAIPAVDLIEINVEDNLRFISSVKKENKLQADGYPVSRGICIQLNTYTGLLYTHGTTPSATKPGGKDFMGGRGIPAPLVIKKHYGPASLETISHEILALTKMNWNSASLYSRLPATIQSSNDIARIGSMLSRFSNKSYDYRLFI